GNVFFALGALVTPVLTDILLRTLGFRRTAALLALASLVPAVLAALAGARGGLPAAGGHTAGIIDLLAHHGLWLAALVFGVYAPLEGAISIWATTYLTE